MSRRKNGIVWLTVAGLLLGQTTLASAQLQPKGINDKVEWKLTHQFTPSAKPMDIAHSLDQKHVFVLTEDHTVQVYDKNGNLKGAIPVDPGVRSIEAGPYGKVLFLSDSETGTISRLSIGFIATIDLSNAPIKGNPEAPVTLAVFSDYQ